MKTLLGQTAQVAVQLQNGNLKYYFLKIITAGDMSRAMCEGEYESLKAIHETLPGFAPEPYAWGECNDEMAGSYFLLEEFRYIAQQPADPENLASKLADLHHRSQSPIGKFGFHLKTCHGRIEQEVDKWDNSWAALFGRHLEQFMNHAKPILQWPEFDVVCDMTLNKIVPRLLLPLQENGRILKPCLVHGDCWDGNTASDAIGNTFVLDACSFYGHNEYDIGDWRPPRHQVSSEAYLAAYKKHYPPSEPVEEWDARHVLYSLTFNIGNAIYIPGSQQRQVVYDDMVMLCNKFYPSELPRTMAQLNQR
ncbi:Fructosamine/Ketosamine-3-kinase [Lophiotrema nucula]|uniref:protein-ribulosamine 3-kinase n=1 Tax=Lophiotrema nucula TaxID=690887 RepID=A0A6A5YJ53_9PLEO|nr:Fructosamine/Ketosamine-3-kinase [Lophiotrema nucula]